MLDFVDVITETRGTGRDSLGWDCHVSGHSVRHEMGLTSTSRSLTWCGSGRRAGTISGRARASLNFDGRQATKRGDNKGGDMAV